jgi:hypothetical protein
MHSVRLHAQRERQKYPTEQTSWAVCAHPLTAHKEALEKLKLEKHVTLGSHLNFQFS